MSNEKTHANNPYLSGHMTMLFVRTAAGDEVVAGNHNGGRIDITFEFLTTCGYEKWEQRGVGGYYEDYLAGKAWLECYTLHDEAWERDYTTNPDAPLLRCERLYDALESLEFANWEPSLPYPEVEVVR